MTRLLMVLLFVYSSQAMGLSPLISLHVTVVDDNGTPIEDAKVRGDFVGVSPGDGNVDYDVTNDGGQAVVRGRTIFHSMLAVEKDGYYKSVSGKIFAAELVDGKAKYMDRDFVVVLRKKLNPIPLYTKKFIGYIPVKKQWIGFDMEKGDWVSPYGKGANADLEFMYDGYYKNFLDAKGRLDMRLPRKVDGIIDVSDAVYHNSKFKVSHFGPDVGYTSAEKWWEISRENIEDKLHRPSESKYYFLRVRTVVDEEGNVLSANYAKVYRDFNLYFTNKKFDLENKKGYPAKVGFQYYYNPTPNDRNLEYDVPHNLFKDLKDREQVYEP